MPIDEALLTPALRDPARLGLITDMDGTLSVIVPVPSDAAPTPRNRDLLQALHAQIGLVAVVSGRGVDDLRQRVSLPELVYVGNHGLERWDGAQVVPAPQAAPYMDAMRAVSSALADLLTPGIWIEDKGVTLSVHYRSAPDPDADGVVFRQAAQPIVDEHGLRAFTGRMVYEVRPPVDIDKGTAYRQLVSEHGLSAALFIGDDTTDADALRAARALRASGEIYGVAVGVESDSTPAAVLESSDFTVSGVSGVEALLSWLLSALSESST